LWRRDVIADWTGAALEVLLYRSAGRGTFDFLQNEPNFFKIINAPGQRFAISENRKQATTNFNKSMPSVDDK
jgi:hypothetical protein